MNEKNIYIIHIIFIGMLLCSITANIAFISGNIHNSKQARLADKQLEQSVADTKNSIKSASDSIESGNRTLELVNSGLQEVSRTAETISNSNDKNIRECGDIGQTIKELRSQIENLENICNNRSGINHNDGNTVQK